MSDINITFPWWAVVLIIAVLWWPLFVCGALISAACAWRFARGRARLVLAGLTALLLLPAIARAAFAGSDLITERAAQRLHRTLDSARTIAGVSFPAQSNVWFTDESLHDIWEADVPAPVRISGVPIGGHMQHENGVWTGRLMSDSRIDGWFCKAGDVKIAAGGRLSTCVLAGPRALRGAVIPIASEVRIDSSIDVTLPPGKPLRLQPFPVTVPARSGLSLTHAGDIEAASFEGSVQFGTVRFASLATWEYGGSVLRAIRGTLAQDARNGTRMFKAGDSVAIGIPDGNLSAR